MIACMYLLLPSTAFSTFQMTLLPGYFFMVLKGVKIKQLLSKALLSYHQMRQKDSFKTKRSGFISNKLSNFGTNPYCYEIPYINCNHLLLIICCHIFILHKRS